MVMSIGYNPFYKNEVRSAEVHVLHRFEKDFYGCVMRVSILGFIRKERDYESLEELVRDIECDCRVAGRSLGRVGWGVKGGEGGEGKWLWGEE
jgi:riboflavin kinase